MKSRAINSITSVTIPKNRQINSAKGGILFWLIYSRVQVLHVEDQKRKKEKMFSTFDSKVILKFGITQLQNTKSGTTIYPEFRRMHVRHI